MKKQRSVILIFLDVHEEAELDSDLPWCPWRGWAWGRYTFILIYLPLMSMKRAEVECSSSVNFWCSLIDRIHQKMAQMHPILNDLLVTVRIIDVSPSPVPWIAEFLQGVKNFWTPEFHELLQSSLQEYEECFPISPGLVHKWQSSSVVPMKEFWFLGGCCFSLGCLACATTIWCKKNKSFKVLGRLNKSTHVCEHHTMPVVS